MSDWDVLAPVEDNVANEGEDQGDVFFHQDDDSFGGGSIGSFTDSQDLAFPTEPASFNPREHRMRRGRKGNPYGDTSYNSYTERKLHLGDEFGRAARGRRGSFQRRGREGHETISHELMQEGGFDEAKYQAFHDSALAQRERDGIGKSTEMNSLYYFWCYYLRNSFNEAMYREFLDMALQDVRGGSHYGIECFFRLCSYGLETRWDPQVFEDFQREAIADHQRGSYYGLEKVKSFLVHNHHEFEIPVSEDITRLLAPFPTLESFKEVSGDKSEERKGPWRHDDGSVTRPRSIPRHRDIGSRGGRRRGGGQRDGGGGGENPRGGRGGRGRGKQGKQHGSAPREFAFGVALQPASAPSTDSPMRNDT